MKLIKVTGTPAWEQRARTLHGSSAVRGKAKAAGTLRRLGEKPKGTSAPAAKK